MTRRDWSDAEVEATVAAYFQMLRKELSDLPYVKASIRRHLLAELNDRSPGAVERKFQNISAAMLRAGLPYVAGYKPLSHYQRSLEDAVLQAIGHHPDVIEDVARQTQESLDPRVALQKALEKVDPPEPRTATRYGEERIRPPRVVDYLEIEARNRAIGELGEHLVVRFEQKRLEACGRSDLARRVEWVSKTKGDGLGFDVKSFDESARDRLIEVKTTRYGSLTPIYFSRNELAVSRQQEDVYHLYRVFEFNRRPRMFSLRGSLDAMCDAEPVQFEGRFL